jgi:DNA-binding Xre family transcriptional regulator
VPVWNRVRYLHAQKEGREKRRISLSEVSRTAGISRQAITAWYSGTVSTFYPEVIEALCNYYECNISDLLVIADTDPGQEAPGFESALVAGPGGGR